MSDHNLSRETRRILALHQNGSPSPSESSQATPSFVLRFFEKYWTLSPAGSTTKPRPFSYTHTISSLLDDISARRIPVDYLDLFDAAHVPFYEGCLIVEMHDNRPQGPRTSTSSANAPPKQRVLLRPTGETLWADLRMLNEKHGSKWSDQDALEIEARIVNATAPPLCLDPDPLVNRIANTAVRATTPNPSPFLKRKQSVVEDVEDEIAKAKRLKIMGMMNPRANRPTAATFNQMRYFSMRKGAIPASFPETAASPRTIPNPSSTPIPSSSAVAPSDHQKKIKGKRKGDEDEREESAPPSSKIKRKALPGKKNGGSVDFGEGSPATPSFPLPAIAVTQASGDSVTPRPGSARPQVPPPQSKKEEEPPQPQTLGVPNHNTFTGYPPKPPFPTLPANRKKPLQQPQQPPPLPLNSQQLAQQMFPHHQQYQQQYAQAQAHPQSGLKMLPQSAQPMQAQAVAQNRFNNAPLMSRSPLPQNGMPHAQILPQYRQQHHPHPIPHGAPPAGHHGHPPGVNPELPVGVGFGPNPSIPYTNFNYQALQLPGMAMGTPYPTAGWRIPPSGPRPPPIQGQQIPMGHPGQ